MNKAFCQHTCFSFSIRNDKQKYAGVAKTVSKKAQHNEAQKKGK